MTGLTIRPKVRESGPGSPRADVGEIDTRAPFQSVKAAVTLFGDVVSPKASSLPLKKSKAEERVLEKETQHQMLMRERGHYMNQARSAEAARAQAQRELQRDNATLRLLTNKLDALTQSKQASIKAAEDAKVRAKQLEEHRARRARLGDDAWKVDVNDERERYKVTTAQLVASKRELSILKQDLEAAEATKTALVQRAEEEEHRAQSNLERQSQLSKEVDEARAALDRVKHASHEAHQEHDRLMEEKEKSLMSYKSAKEEADKEIERLKQEYVPAELLQEKLQQTMEAISVMQQKLQEIQSSDLYIVRKMAIDLNSAKKALEEAIAEEHSLHTAIDLFKHELKDVKKKMHESEKKAVKAEATVEKMQGHLDKKEAELEKALSGSACAMLTSIEHHLAEAKLRQQELLRSSQRNESTTILRRAKLLICKTQTRSHYQLRSSNHLTRRSRTSETKLI